MQKYYFFFIPTGKFAVLTFLGLYFLDIPLQQQKCASKKKWKKVVKGSEKRKKKAEKREKPLFLTEKKHYIKIKMYLCKVYTTLMLWNKKI